MTTALIALVAIPIGAGSFRLVRLAHGEPITAESARFFAAPAPVVIHILCVTVFCVLGAFQLAAGFRRRFPVWHRRAGKLVFASGVGAALSGLWMTHFYPPAPGDGPVLYFTRLLVGTGMLASLLLGVSAARRRDFAQHRAWMLRGYALGMGAGTQAVLHLPWLLVLGLPGERGRAALMLGGWAINWAFAEWRIRRAPGGALAPRLA